MTRSLVIGRSKLFEQEMEVDGMIKKKILYLLCIIIIAIILRTFLVYVVVYYGWMLALVFGIIIIVISYLIGKKGYQERKGREEKRIKKIEDVLNSDFKLVLSNRKSKIK